MIIFLSVLFGLLVAGAIIFVQTMNDFDKACKRFDESAAKLHETVDKLRKG